MKTMQDVISEELRSREKLIQTDSVVAELKQKSRRNYKAILFWVFYIVALVFVVFNTHDSEQGVIVTAIGKTSGVAVLLFIAVFAKSFWSFFAVSKPSTFKNKYHHYILTNERIIFLSKNFAKLRAIDLHELENLDVIDNRNRITFNIRDPLEPTISFNGMPNVLKLASLIKQNLPYCEEHAYLKELTS